MARRNGNGVQLYTRNGYDFAGRFPQIVEAVSKLKVRSCVIDGEAIVVDRRGLSAFDLLCSAPGGMTTCRIYVTDFHRRRGAER
jgi:bifunctional non-homologous end joining protein LigD